MLWVLFAASGRAMALRGGAVGPDERRLFHGTAAAAAAAAAAKIVVQGCDHGFASTHQYGAGVYFARDARDSVSHSPADAAGLHRVFLSLCAC